MSMKFLKTVAGAAVSSLWEKVSGNIVPKDTDANVGIGTDSPVSNLHVASSAGGRIQSTSDSSGHTASDGLALSMDGVLRGYLWVYDNSYMEFATNNTSHMILEADGDLNLKAGNFIVGTAGKGIDFSAQTATNTGTPTGELLNHYEEGTWTGVISDGSSNATMAAADTTGKYTRIGNTDFVTGFFITTSLGSVSGDIYLTGLPFTVGNDSDANYGSISCARGGALNLGGAGQNLSMHTEKNNTRTSIMVWDATAGCTAMQGSEWSADGQIIISGNYMVS